MGVLTTGFNAPAVDLIAMLRPTKSTGLYVQMAGRGTRLAPGKDNCLVLDFAGNVARHGPIDLVKPKDKANGGEATARRRSRSAPTARPSMPWRRGSAPTAATSSRRRRCSSSATATHATDPEPADREWVDVGAVTYHRAREARQAAVAAGRLPLRPGPAPRVGLPRAQRLRRPKAVAWWRAGPRAPVPRTVDEALARADELRQPVQIAVRPSGRFTEVVHARFASPCLCAVCRREARGFGWFDARFGASAIPAAMPAGAGSARWPARTSAIGGGA